MPSALFTKARAPEDDWDRTLLANRHSMDAALLRGFELYKPVVVGVNGHALAGGTEILLGTNFRIASSEATFGTTEVRWGIIPAGGSLVRLARQIPYTAAMEIILGGEPISVQAALRYGLVSRVVPPGEVLAGATDVAWRVARGAPIALRKTKESVGSTSGLPRGGVQDREPVRPGGHGDRGRPGGPPSVPRTPRASLAGPLSDTRAEP